MRARELSFGCFSLSESRTPNVLLGSRDYSLLPLDSARVRNLIHSNRNSSLSLQPKCRGRIFPRSDHWNFALPTVPEPCLVTSGLVALFSPIFISGSAVLPQNSPVDPALCLWPVCSYIHPASVLVE